MDRLWSMWMSGEKVRLLCWYCRTRNEFTNGKCNNCGARPIKEVVKKEYILSTPYFVSF